MKILIVPDIPSNMLNCVSRAIYTRKNKTRLKQDANFPYKRHISSKIRRGLAKTRLILEQPLTPVLR